MNTATISGVEHNALGPEAVAIASCDPPLHAPAITALCPDISPRDILMLIVGLMLTGMVSDPCRPVHGYRRRAGAATVRSQDVPIRTPHAMEFGSRNLVHSHPRHSREVPERLLHLPIPSLYYARESDCCYPVRSDLRRTREEPEQPHRFSPHIVESGYSIFWHLHLRRSRGVPEQLPPLLSPMPDARP